MKQKRKTLYLIQVLYYCIYYIFYNKLILNGFENATGPKNLLYFSVFFIVSVVVL
jgi:hypothetical protein